MVFHSNTFHLQGRHLKSNNWRNLILIVSIKYVSFQIIELSYKFLNLLSASGKKTVRAGERDFPQDKKTLNDLERERAMQAAIYEQLLQRVGVSEVSKQMEVADKATTFRIVDPAILPTTPVGVHRIVLMFLAVLGGLTAGLGAVYVSESLDSSIKRPESLREMGVTVLAEIPFIWSDMESLLIRKKDKIALAFAGVCTLLVGVMIMHDLLGLTLIDGVLKNLDLGSIS